MFSGIIIGIYLAFWIYMIWFRHKEFDRDAFQLFMLISGVPFILWVTYNIL
jgi:hypothetical protein